MVRAIYTILPVVDKDACTDRKSVQKFLDSGATEKFNRRFNR
jgi:hypothetical protein